MHFVFIKLVDSVAPCMYLRCCMSVAIINFIGSNSSRFPFHQSPVGKPSEEEDFLGKKWLRARLMDGQGRMHSQCTSKRKRVFVCDTHRRSGQKQFHQGGSLPTNWWVMVGRGGAILFSLWVDQDSSSQPGNQPLPLSCSWYPYYPFRRVDHLDISGDVIIFLKGSSSQAHGIQVIPFSVGWFISGRFIIGINP